MNTHPKIIAAGLLAAMIVMPLSVQAYICGDHNGDGVINVGDAVHVIQFVFNGGPACSPAEAGDANCDGTVNVGDAVSIINRVFLGGPEPCSMCPPVEQPILFEMSFSNYAWFDIYHGYYINNEGLVIRYIYTAPIPYADPWHTELTEAELMERYSQNAYATAIVSPEELAHHNVMIPHAEAGELAPPLVRCYDMGLTYYVAFVYNDVTELYQPVLLYQHGNIAQKNYSPEADALFLWMMRIVGDSPDDILCPYPGD